MKYLEAIKEYWNTQVDSFSEINVDELKTDKYKIWLSALEEAMPTEEGLSVLDAGCGPGFFSIVMARLGHNVVAIDYNEGMLKKAEENAKTFGVGDRGIRYIKMDAQNLDFKDGSFDVVLSRNITWVLEDPTQAYREWLRVLKPKGRIINFDANWFLHHYDEDAMRAYRQGENDLIAQGFALKNGDRDDLFSQITYRLPLTRVWRPGWDVKELSNLGCEKIIIQPQIPGKIYDDYYQIMYAHIPTFMICAMKK